MNTVSAVAGLREAVSAWRRAGARVALVPTMGALHAGHVSLIRLARARADRVVVSVFVNPTQFGPNEDFDAYPRDLDGDRRILADAGVDLLYAPSPAVMYPPGFATAVSVRGVSEVLCGAARPGHFDGVAQVVCKLLLQALPDLAIFGEKDYQQLQVIRRLVSDLDVPVEIVGAPIFREPDGLALSSRNRYLSAEERARAPRLHQVITDIATALAAGKPPAPALAAGRAALVAAGFDPVDYLEVRHADDLSLVHATPARAARVFVAARLGRARLIDNVAVGTP